MQIMLSRKLLQQWGLSYPSLLGEITDEATDWLRSTRPTAVTWESSTKVNDLDFFLLDLVSRSGQLFTMFNVSKIHAVYCSCHKMHGSVTDPSNSNEYILHEYWSWPEYDHISSFLLSRGRVISERQNQTKIHKTWYLIHSKNYKIGWAWKTLQKLFTPNVKEEVTL